MSLLRGAVSRFLEDLFRIRPEELRRTGLAFAYLFCAIGAFIISRVARSVLFLELPDYKEQLPLAYVGTAAGVSLAMYGYARVERVLRRDLTNEITLVILTIITLGFRVALTSHTHAIAWAFYVWVEVLGAFLVVQFWIFTGEIFHSRQAKRLFAVIGGGGVVANIVIGFAISGTVKSLGTENLLYIIAILMLAALETVILLGRDAAVELASAKGRPGSRKKTEGSRSLSAVFATRHVRLIAAVVVLTYIVSTLVDYQFQVVIGDSIAGKDDRSAYFGTFFGVTGLLSGVIQFFLTARILERFGVLIALMLLPFCMLGGSVGMAMAGAGLGLWAVSATKGSENVLRYTVNDSSVQLLYLPLPAHLRGLAKATIDGMLKPVAIGFSGILLALLVGQLNHFLGTHIQVNVYQLSWIVAGALLFWLFALWNLKKEYFHTLLTTLQRRRLNFADARFQINDEGTAKVVKDALAAPEMGQVLHALELLPFVGDKQRGALEKCVLTLLDHRDEQVRVAALDYLQQSSTLPPIKKIVPLVADRSPAVRASAIRAYCAIAHEKAIDTATEILIDKEPSVRAAAVAGLIRYSGLDGVLASADQLKTMLRSPTCEERGWAAWILGEIGVQHFYQPLLPLLSDPDPNVRHRAIEAAGRLRSQPLAEEVIRQLAVPALATVAIEALAAYGETIEPRLAELLADVHQVTGLRPQVAKVLSRLGSQNAARILAQRLEDADPLVATAAISSLANLARHHPGVPLDMEAIDRAMRGTAKRFLMLMVWTADLRLDAGALLLTDALSQRRRQCVSQLLSLLPLKYSPETIDLVNRNLQSPVANTRANAIEVLDNLLEKTDKAFCLPLLEEGGDERKLVLASEMFGIARREREQRLLEILHGPDRWLTLAAMMATATWGLHRMGSELRVLLKDDNPLVRETALVALHTLGEGALTRELVQPLTADPAPQVSRYAQHLLTSLA